MLTVYFSCKIKWTEQSIDQNVLWITIEMNNSKLINSLGADLHVRLQHIQIPPLPADDHEIPELEVDIGCGYDRWEVVFLN